MGVMLAEAAGYYENMEIGQTQSYGPEARGGACRVEVVIVDEMIDYTKTLNADVFVAMSPPALDRYLPEIDPETAVVFVDEMLVTAVPEAVRHLCRIPATRLTEEQCGSRVVANTVMLAAVVQKTGIISLEALRRTIRERLAPRLRDINLKALEITLAYLERRGYP
jgi:2-oxoglutarate ferredoxin oxidoreductase subunit gamma